MSLLTDRNRKWWTLGAVTFSLFMIMLDVTIVNVALPAIQGDLDMTITKLEWTVTAYTLTYAVFLLTGGKLADFLGRRRIFIVGLVVFTGTSLACGLASSGDMLIAARAAQGVGAALMLPATLSIISATFAPEERGTAIGIWAGTSALGLALGPLVGGLFIEGIDWRWIFYVNVPIGVVGLATARLVIPESRDTSAEQTLDVPGLAVSGIALFALTFGLIEGNRFGWGSPEIVGSFAAAAVALVAFVVLELRLRVPMLDLHLFRNPTFAGANVVGLFAMLAMFGVLFFVSLYLQRVLGYSALEAGATFLPMTLLLAFSQPLAGKASDRIGWRPLMVSGMLLAALALFLLSRLGSGSNFWDLVAPLAIGGLGMGMTMTPMTAAVLASVSVDKSGIASGVLNTFRQAGGALGIALMGAILVSQVAGLDPDGRAWADAFVVGFRDANLAGAFACLAGAATAALTIGPKRALVAAPGSGGAAA